MHNVLIALFLECIITLNLYLQDEGATKVEEEIQKYVQLCNTVWMQLNLL